MASFLRVVARLDGLASVKIICLSVPVLSWKCRCFRCHPQLVLRTCLGVFPTRWSDMADVSATSCDVGFFFSVSYVVSLPNCRHDVVVTTTTYHTTYTDTPIKFAKFNIMLNKIYFKRDLPASSRRTYFNHGNNMVKRGGPKGRPYKPPWPLEPQPFHPLFDFRVILVWDQVARLLSSAWSQNHCA